MISAFNRPPVKCSFLMSPRFCLGNGLWLCLVGIFFFAAPELSRAYSAVSLDNGGFESPDLGIPQPEVAYVQDWQSNGAVGTRLLQSGDLAFPAPEGSQVAWGNATEMQLFQSPVVIAANTLYTLELSLFALQDRSQNWATVALEEDGGDFTVFDQLLYHPSWNPGQEDFDLTPQQWISLRIQFNSADYASHVGQTLRIRVAGYYLAVDDVRLYSAGTRAARDFVVSSSEGDDGNDGLSTFSPWASFAPFARVLLQPGDRIFLKRGDQWQEELSLYGAGTAESPILLGAYGEGPRPLIEREDLVEDRCVVIQNASHWYIRDLHCRNAKLGLYLRYINSYNNTNMNVEDSCFEDMDSWEADSSTHGYEYAFNAGLFVGGAVNDQYATVLDGLTIRHCAFLNCTAGFISAWYFPESINNRLNNVTLEHNYATRTAAGAMSLNSMSNVTVRDFRTFEYNGNPGDFEWGSTGAIVWRCLDVLIEDSEFAETDRMWHDNQQGDGCGFDLDGMNENVTIRDCVYHDNESNGQLFLNTPGIISGSTQYRVNTNMVIADSTFYNNGLDAAVTFGGNAYAIKATSGCNSGSSFSNLGFYASDVAWGWIYPDPVPASEITLSNIRENYYADVRNRPMAWTFNTAGDWEGWQNFSADWQNAAVVNGALEGVAGSGSDPYAQTPALFIDTFRHETLELVMRSNGGDTAQVFFITETDPFWDGTKTIAFSVNTDGNFHRYSLDMESLDSWSGVVTGLRVDPTMQAGAEFAIDSLTVSTTPWVKSLTRVDDTHLEIVFNEPIRTGAHETQNYMVWGQGRGTVALHPDAVTLVSNATYRLGWESGLLGETAKLRLSVSDLQDRYLNPVAAPDLGTAPVFNQNPLNLPDALAGENYGVELAGYVTDPDVFDGWTFSKVSGPSWLEVEEGGTVTGTPTNGHTGLTTAVVEVEDTAGQTGQTEIQIHVLFNPALDPAGAEQNWECYR